MFYVWCLSYNQSRLILRPLRSSRTPTHTTHALTYKSMVFDAAEAAAAAAASGPPSSPDPTESGWPGQGRRPSYSGSGGSGRKLSGAPSASLRGLLSIFDTSARSPPVGDDGSVGGVGGYASAGPVSARRWVGAGRKGRKKRAGGGGGGARSRRRKGLRRDAVSPSPGRGASWRTGGGRTRRRSGSVGGVTDFGSPVRRHSISELGYPLGGGGGGYDGAGGVTDGTGDFVGGGHALCRARSRWAAFFFGFWGKGVWKAKLLGGWSRTCD